MLTVRIEYHSPVGHKTPILESLNESILTNTARSILAEYTAAADACPDDVLAALIRTEARQARHVLIAAGLSIREEACHV